MKAFFKNPEALLRLAAAVPRWLGTPFFPHGTTPGLGGGCSCQTLVAGVYRDAGFLPDDFFAPTGSLDRGFEPMVDVLSGHAATGKLARVWHVEEGGELDRQAGDLLLFKLGRRGHLAILTGGDKFIHVLKHANACERRLDDPNFAKLLVSVWRPLEVGA